MSEPERQDAPDAVSPGRQAYNIVTDTVVGPNIRWRDNLLQAAIAGLCLVLGIPIGALIAWIAGGNGGDQIGFAIVGGFVGLVVGLFGSGIFLMVFRAVRHLRGKHD